MKKKLVLALLCVGAIAMLGGCGTASDNISSDSATEGSASDATIASADIEYDVDDYVTLGDYKGLSVDVENKDSYTVTDENVKTQVESDIADNPYMKLDKTTVEGTDLVTIEYVGKIDGEVFEGGSSTAPVVFDIANNSDVTDPTNPTTYIDGFGAGIVGAEVGKSVDVPVTFPEDYNDTDKAGKDAVFTITVNSINVAANMTYDTLTDAYVSENLGYDTVDKYLAGVRSDLEATAESDKQTAVKSAVLSAVMENCKVSGFPDGLLEARVAEYKQQYQDMCDQYGIELADYLSSYYQMTEEQFDEQLETYMTSNLEQEFVLQAIAKAEKFTADDEAFTEYVNNVVINNGYEDADALYAQYGEEYVQNAYIYYEKTINFLVDSSKITYTEPEAADTTTEGATSDAAATDAE